MLRPKITYMFILIKEKGNYEVPNKTIVFFFQKLTFGKKNIYVIISKLI